MRSGGAVRPSLADCKAVFRAKTSKQRYSKRRYSACKWSRPFLYREEDNEYHKGKKRHLDWVGRSFSRPRKTLKATIKSEYDNAYRFLVNEIKEDLTIAENNLKNDEASLKPFTAAERLIDRARWILKGRRAVAKGKDILASLERRRTTPDIRDRPNVDLLSGSLRGKLRDLQADLSYHLSPYGDPDRRYST